ncbi:MAG: dihydrolipoyl dehydrogenase [Deltaproteobacteria bacterium]|nr:dihydrolipoyl dehydrogenase [Deltaproteobacteria bacterium]
MVMGEFTQETELLVVGGGPGGYAAAFRAADLGLEVTLVEQDPKPGGVCLHRGCIPSKSLLHLSEIMDDAGHAASMGVTFSRPSIDLERIREWKNSVNDRLADGLLDLCEKRGVQYLQGRAVFESPDHCRLSESQISHIKFKHAILCTGSRPSSLPHLEFGKEGRVMDSTLALDLRDIPESLLVVGAGYVALEMGSVYAALGSKVTLIVHRERMVRAADPDLTAPLKRRLGEIFHSIHFNTKVTSVREEKDHVEVTMEGEIEPSKQRFERILVAVGRDPNSNDLGLENTQVRINKRGYVQVDEQQRTSDPRIFAVGDVVGGYMLAHKAMHEGKVAAEVIAGRPSAFDARAIPAIVYTNPQIAWCGLTEEQARAEGRPIKVTRFPWKFSGRALSMDAPLGLTKMIFDPDTQRILGVGAVGRQAEGLIAEAVLAVEMGALAEDVALSVHAHPTLSETEGEVADIFLGRATHVLPKKTQEMSSGD